MIKKVPMLRPGYQVRIHQKIKEGGKERIQIFEGLVVSLNAGNGASKTFTVRKVVEGIGVEKIFPLYSPLIEKIQITKTFASRRAKLNFLRSAGNVSRRLSTKLGLQEKDAAHEKKKGIMEDEAETAETPSETSTPSPTENSPEPETETSAEPAAEEPAAPETPTEPEKAPAEDEKK